MRRKVGSVVDLCAIEGCKGGEGLAAILVHRHGAMELCGNELCLLDPREFGNCFCPGYST